VNQHPKQRYVGSNHHRSAGIGRFLLGTAAGRAYTHGVDGTSAPSVRHGRAVLTSLSLAFAALVVSVMVLFLSPAPDAAAACPNESIRAEQGEAGLALPDCRAYEMVSPVTSAPTKEASSRAASVSGDRATYRSWNPYQGQGGAGLYYVSERSSDGWTTRTPIPPQNGATTSIIFACTPSFAVTPEMQNVVLVDGIHDPGTEDAECFGDDPPLVPGEPRGFMNIFRTDPAGTFYELANQPPAGAQPENGLLQAYNSDASVIVFTEWAQLTPDAPEPESREIGNGAHEENVYVWSEGTIRYVAYLPDGTPVLGHLVSGHREFYGGQENIANIVNAVSEDGERIFFEHQSKLYLRENALQEPSTIVGETCTEPEKACTVPIDTSDEGPSEYGFFGGRERSERGFLYASQDGSRAFFMDVRKLTPDSTAALPVKNSFGNWVNGKPDLYEFNSETGEVTDLTVNPGEPASVRGLAGASEDASHLYFVAYGNLTGAEQNSEGDSAIAGRANLYLLHEGTTTFIATMGGGESGPSGSESWNWQEGPTDSPATTSSRNLNTGRLNSSVSANGKFIAFASTASLTGFDSTPAEPGLCQSLNGAVPGDGCMELFVYDADAGELSCASCSPTEEPPVGDVSPFGVGGVNTLFGGPAGEGPSYMTRTVSETGSVFFQTPNPLLPADVNGDEDVYQYRNGELHLISTGSGDGASRFMDASADGSSVFFATGEGLVGRDTDGGASLYVARVNGGFAEPPPLPGCEGEACRGPATAAAAGAGAGTAHFTGPGNRKARHKRDCRALSKRAVKLSKSAKRLRRQARQKSGGKAAKLRRKAGKLAGKGQKFSKKAKSCRRANRRAGK
jgi:hypothetical protein